MSTLFTPNMRLTAAHPDSPNIHVVSRFFMGGTAGSFGMWLLMRGTPLFNSYHAQNKRLVHVLFPTFVASGVGLNMLWNRNRENSLIQRWGTDPVVELIE